jgi:hypothetical protein
MAAEGLPLPSGPTISKFVLFFGQLRYNGRNKSSGPHLKRNGASEVYSSVVFQGRR